MSFGAFAVASGNLIALSRGWVSSVGSRGPALVVSILSSVGSFGEIIGVHLKPEKIHGTLSWLSTISDYSELFATSCGVVTSTGSYVDDKDGKAKTVATFTAVGDVIWTTISVIGGELVPSHFLPARPVSLMPLLISGAKVSRVIIRVEADHYTSFNNSCRPRRVRRARGMNMTEFIDLLCLVIQNSHFS